MILPVAPHGVKPQVTATAASFEAVQASHPWLPVWRNVGELAPAGSVSGPALVSTGRASAIQPRPEPSADDPVAVTAAYTQPLALLLHSG